MSLRQILIQRLNHLRVHADALRTNLPLWITDSIFLLTQAISSPRGRPGGDSSSPTGRSGGGKKTVLLLRLDAIGDFVLWTDAARGLRELYPRDKYHITLLGNRAWTELADDIGLFDAIIPLDRKKFTHSIPYRYRLLSQIRSTAFEAVIETAFSRLFALGDSVARAVRAKEKVCFSGDSSVEHPWWKLLSNRWYTKVFPADLSPKHELERNAELVRNLGLQSFRASLPRLEPKGELPRELKGIKYYVVGPGASVGRKQWPISNFADVISHIHKQTGYIGVICGGPGELILGELLMKNCNAPLINLIGKTTLNNMIKIISGARFFLGNDSAAVHFASAVGIPAVSTLGGGHYGRFLPYNLELSYHKTLINPVIYQMDCFGCGWKCKYEFNKNKATPCIVNIHPDVVKERVSAILC